MGTFSYKKPLPLGCTSRSAVILWRTIAATVARRGVSAPHQLWFHALDSLDSLTDLASIHLNRTAPRRVAKQVEPCGGPNESVYAPAVVRGGRKTAGRAAPGGRNSHSAGRAAERHARPRPRWKTAATHSHRAGDTEQECCATRAAQMTHFQHRHRQAVYGKTRAQAGRVIGRGCGRKIVPEEEDRHRKNTPAPTITKPRREDDFEEGLLGPDALRGSGPL